MGNQRTGGWYVPLCRSSKKWSCHRWTGGPIGNWCSTICWVLRRWSGLSGCSKFANPQGVLAGSVEDMNEQAVLFMDKWTVRYLDSSVNLPNATVKITASAYYKVSSNAHPSNCWCRSLRLQALPMTFAKMVCWDLEPVEILKPHVWWANLKHHSRTGYCWFDVDEW